MLKFAGILYWILNMPTVQLGMLLTWGAGAVRVVVGDVVGCFMGFFWGWIFFFLICKATSKRVYIVIKQCPYLGI